MTFPDPGVAFSPPHSFSPAEPDLRVFDDAAVILFPPLVSPEARPLGAAGTD